jgi:membrane-associated phospholipid phosphatase
MKTHNKPSTQLLSLSLLIGFVAAVAALIFFAWLTDEVLEGDSQRFDEVTRLAVHEFASPAMTRIMRGISFLGDTLFLTLATTTVIVWFAVKKLKREAKLFAVTMIGASLLNTTLKLAFKRPRPVPYFNLLAPETFSFPSGHSLASCCFYAALAAMLAARIQRKRVRVALWIFAVTMFLLIGLSRIYLGVHYTTDVIAGFAAALIWIMVVRFVELQLARRKRRSSLRVGGET